MRSSSSSTAANALRLWVLALCAAALSCAKTPTQIAFRVLAEDLVPGWCDGAAYRSDPRCPASAYRIEQILVRVCRGGPCRSPTAMTCVDGDLFCRTYVDSPRPTVLSLLPGDITVAPSEPSAGGRVGISVIATVRVPGAAGDPPTREYIPRRFVVPFVPETTQLVEVWLTSLCIGALCPPETTCGRRSCEREDSPVTRPFTPLPAPGPVDGGDRDVTFDVRPRDAATDAMGVDAGTMDVDAAALDADAAALDADAAALDADAAPPDVDLMDAPSEVADAVVADVDRSDRCAIGACGRAVAIGAGGNGACAVRAGGVWCWGANPSAGIDGAPPLHGLPVQRVVPTAVQRVAVGRRHTCAWWPGGEIHCWGDNTFGQLGTGTTMSSDVALRVSGVATPRDVAAGDDFTCAVDGSGSVLCWGVNAAGQCGQAARDPILTPRVVPGVSDATRVSVGGSHACALLAGGAVHCWGLNNSGQLGRPFVRGMDAPGVVAGLSASAVFLGQTHSCAITGSEVRCWGNPSGLRLGTPLMLPSQPTPTLVPGVTPMPDVTGVAGDQFSCVITARSTVQCWGAGAFGQLGHTAGTTNTAAPAEGGVQNLLSVVELAAGARHVCARTGGAVHCWGANTHGQLGRGTNAQPRATPRTVSFDPPVTSAAVIASGGGHACAIVNSAVWCWGAGTQGQLGNGRFGHTSVPVRVSSGVGAGPTALCAGLEHTCAIYGTAVWCWGANALGQLGDGMAMTRSAVPVSVVGLPSTPLSLACGSSHTCARLTDDSVHCWGSNSAQVLAAALPGGATYRATPGPVAGLSATAIASGLSSMCAVRGDGSVVCWGAGFAGQLGDGLTVIAARAAPLAVDRVVGAAGVTGGALHHCAWSGAGVQCWGTNDNRQLGQVSMRSPLAAGPVPSLTAIVVASGGYLHTCAIHGGALSCWGDNTQRACGALTGNVVTAPTAVALPAPPTALAAGGGATPEIDDPSTFTCAIVEGAPLCWGSNQVGELGDGAAFSTTPVEVMLPAP